MKKTLLSLGHGYTARALARLLLPQGWRIIGTTRDEHYLDTLRAEDITALLWPGTDLRSALAQATHLLVSIAPDSAGDPVLNAMAADISDAAPFEWTGYLSTTGVYGDHQGGWVTERTPLTPATKRGKHRVMAEAQWQTLAQIQSLNLHIFRLAGIYGSDRGPLAKVRAGTARRIIKPDQVFSRIHVDDIAQTLAASIAQPNPNAVYNVCDDDPAPPQDVLAYAAQLLNKPIPAAEAWDTADMTPMARSFYAENKRVANDRIKSELGVQLKFPDYRRGLDSLIR